MADVIKGDVKCPIKPSDIDTTKHFYDAFGNSETEVSARYIARFCQEKGDWDPFTQKEIEDFYNRVSGHVGFGFNRLIPDGFIVEHDGKFYLTLQFVSRVYTSSPKL